MNEPEEYPRAYLGNGVAAYFDGTDVLILGSPPAEPWSTDGPEQQQDDDTSIIALNGDALAELVQFLHRLHQDYGFPVKPRKR